MNPREKARAAVESLKDAIVEYLAAHPGGASHVQIFEDLNLRSDYEGTQRNYLSWSVLGLLLAEKRVRYEGQGRSKLYFKC